jgi:uncharacterized membrane protein YdbT with pleckstrin-like domain
MGIPLRMLDEGEEVVVDVRPHWSFMALPTVFTLAVVVAATAVAVGANPPSWAAMALVGVIGAAVIWLFGRYVRWTTTTLVLTDRRVVVRRGVMSSRTREIPIDRLNDVTVHRSLVERLIGRGTLVLESGGERGQEVVPGIPSPIQVQRAIHLRVEQRLARRHPWPSGLQGRSLTSDLHELDDLRRNGLITPAEFEAKRAELLDRL